MPSSFSPHIPKAVVILNNQNIQGYHNRMPHYKRSSIGWGHSDPLESFIFQRDTLLGDIGCLNPAEIEPAPPPHLCRLRLGTSWPTIGCRRTSANLPRSVRVWKHTIGGINSRVAIDTIDSPTPTKWSQKSGIKVPLPKSGGFLWNIKSKKLPTIETNMDSEYFDIVDYNFHLFSRRLQLIARLAANTGEDFSNTGYVTTRADTWGEGATPQINITKCGLDSTYRVLLTMLTNIQIRQPFSETVG
ncbi:hypothetical protein RF11_08984 [Thelohanellus kitauei]|uniref:Uncharacterized protein n=1 Tax=Thelohanellus kitauei TaxID=669202 RepID=A0A0C2IBV2_THEKT|nr:hypothetical protein RF11_08984 [Thelohanellus kitauei]